METSRLAEVRAANRDTLHSLYFPDGGRVSAAAVARCVCLDDLDLTCTECERILGDSFVAIVAAVRKKQRTDPPVPVARVDAGSEQEHRVEGSVAAVSGMADRVKPSSHPPSDGVEESDAVISSMEDQPGRRSHPPSDGTEGPADAAISSVADLLGPGSNGVVEGFEAAIASMAARLGLPAAVGERAKEVFRKMEEAMAWPHGPGCKKSRSGCPLAYAACLSIACRNEGSALSLKELARAAAHGGAVTKKDVARLIAHIRRRLGKEAGQSTGISMGCVSSYVRRYGALVGLREAATAEALEAARRLEEGIFEVRHNADTVAAAVVCMALERAGVRRTGVKDVAAASAISKETIYEVCRKLRAHDNLLFG